MADADLVIPRFFIHTTPDEVASKEKGRPIFSDLECIEIKFAANKQTIAVFPAHEVWQWDEIDGIRQEVTYAMRFADQYKRFKASEAQVMHGTPLEELPFLKAYQRSELKALSIYTAETLAALDGQPLKQLGGDGRALKAQAEAYLKKATDTASLTQLVGENAALRARIEELTAIPAASALVQPVTASPFNEMDDEALKEWIKDAAGERPRGNPKHDTLVKMADEINADLARKRTEQVAA